MCKHIGTIYKLHSRLTDRFGATCLEGYFCNQGKKRALKKKKL